MKGKRVILVAPRVPSAVDSFVTQLSTFRANAAGFLDQIHKTRRPLVITQHGRSSAVVLDVEEYEAMVEELDVIRDIRIGLLQLDAGQGVPHEEVMAEPRSMLLIAEVVFSPRLTTSPR